jgi:hypothetical protein
MELSLHRIPRPSAPRRWERTEEEERQRKREKGKDKGKK